FGNILTVPNSDLFLMLILDAVILLTVFLLYKEFLAVSFDQEFSKVVGVPSKLIYLLLLCIVALSVVILIKAVGVILVIALLSIPAAISRQMSHKISSIMFLSVIWGILLTTLGVWLSYIFNLASGATIVLVLGVAFFVTMLVKKYW
ncbi:MAG: metal ABC transporter permease, partial [Methanobacterium sp.]